MAQQQNHVLVLDFAYQCFGYGLKEDDACLEPLIQSGCDLLICNSFSKNFGLYSERVGALTMVSATAETAAIAGGTLMVALRDGRLSVGS